MESLVIIAVFYLFRTDASSVLITNSTNAGIISGNALITETNISSKSRVDLSGPISINENPTVMKTDTSFAPPNTNYGGHGEVVALGNVFDSHGGPAFYAIDGDMTTSDIGAYGYLGLHTTNVCVATRLRFVPMPSAMPYTGGFTGSDKEMYCNGMSYGTCANPSFGSPVPIGTTPGTPMANSITTNYYPRYQWAEITNGFPTAPSSYFCLGFTNLSSYIGIAEMRWIVIGTTDAAPVAPVIAPWGGFFTNGLVTVTLSSISTAASNYYTLDGSKPTGPSHGILYTGPFQLNCLGHDSPTNPISLQAVSYDAGLYQPCSTVSSNAFFYGAGFIPLVTQYDQNGNPVYARSGMILDDRQNGNGFLLYGDYDNQAQQSPNIWGSLGTRVYQSQDCLNWTDYGFADLSPFCGIESSFQIRAKVAFNSNTHQYVLWSYTTGNAANGFQDSVATSSLPTGPFSYVTTNNQVFGAGINCGDINLMTFNGNCFLIQVSNPPYGGIWISKLDPTWTTNVGNWVNITPTYHEGDAVFPVAGGFDCIASVGNYYDSTSKFNETNWFCPGTNPLGQWNQGGPLFPTDPFVLTGYSPTNLFNGQSASVLQCPWNTNQFIYQSDYWYNGFTPFWNPLLGAYTTSPTINTNDGTKGILANSASIWLPLTITGTNVTAQVTTNWWPAEWINPLISGTVTNTNGAPVAGVQIQVGNLLATTTDGNGNYSIGVPSGWSGVITPTGGMGMFVPASLALADVTNLLIGENFLTVSTIAPGLSAGLDSSKNLSIGWLGLAGINYQAFLSTNLVTWQLYGTSFSGSNSPIQVAFPSSNSPSMFFRIKAAY